MPECQLGGPQHRDPAIARYRHNNLRGGQITKEGTLRYICSSHFANEIKYWDVHVAYEPLFGQWTVIDEIFNEVEKYLGRKPQAKEVVFDAQPDRPQPEADSAVQVPPEGAEEAEETHDGGSSATRDSLGVLLESEAAPPSADELQEDHTAGDFSSDVPEQTDPQ